MFQHANNIGMLDALERDSFTNAFGRFVSRRSCTRKIWSDNGTNLVGARAELSRGMRQFDWAKVIQAARWRDVEWIFDPPLAFHYGWVWERVIRTIRRVLVAILNSTQHITDNVLHTALCKVEGIVNRQNSSFAWGKFDENDKLLSNFGVVAPANICAMAKCETQFAGGVRMLCWSVHICRPKWVHFSGPGILSGVGFNSLTFPKG